MRYGILKMINGASGTSIEKGIDRKWKSRISICPRLLAKAVRCLAMPLAILAASGAFSTEARAEGGYTISSAWFDDYNGRIIARWDESASKTKYRIQLFKGAAYDSSGSTINANKVGNAIRTSGESHDVTKLIKDEGAGTYCFTVYPVEDPTIITLSDTIQITYDRLNGTSDQTGWQKIGGYWYYYAEDGELRYGWQYIDGAWYYLSNKGACLLNAYTPDGYYVDANGVWDGNPKSTGPVSSVNE